MGPLPIFALVLALPASEPASWSALVQASEVPADRPQQDEHSPPADLDFERDVRPLLAARCFGCHGPKKQKSSLRLDRRAPALRGGDSGEPAVVPGDSAASLLITLISEDDRDFAMPPKGDLLKAHEVELLRRWIDQGADWGVADEGESGKDHWSLQPIVRPPLPPATSAEWSQPIDRFILAGLAAAGLEPSPEAHPAVLIRRMSLILCGLPPAPEEVADFISSAAATGTADQDSYEKLLERLLGSTHYGERWARHWLDVARFAETNGFETNTPRPTAWHYRDYVVRAFNEDMPYDRFITEQLAGDVLGADAATGFLVGGAYDTVKSPDEGLTKQQRQDELADMINTTSTAFMGLTVACARCHDHKFDPITQTDYYAMQAIFAGVRHGERPLRPAGHAARLARLEDDKLELNALRAELDALPDASARFTGMTAMVIDDQESERVTLLRDRRNRPENPAGKARGQRGDRGDTARLPNISGGSFSRWTGATDEDLLAYSPQLEGSYRLWLSWGVNGKTQASDAGYFLDVDGDLTTVDDRKLLATVDQRGFADGDQPSGETPLWSGLLDIGVHEFTASTQVVLRAGTAGRPVTADTIVLQEATPASSAMPRLRPGVSAKLNREEFSPVLATKLRFRAFRTNSKAEPCLDELEVYAHEAGLSANVNIALLATHTTSGNYVGNAKHQQLHLNDGLYGNDHSWISNTKGSGWVELEFAEPARIETVIWGRDRTGAYTDRLATDYVIQIMDSSGAWRAVASSNDRLAEGMSLRDVPAYRFAGSSPELAQRVAALLDRISRIERTIARWETLPRVYAGVFEQPRPTHRLYRGDPLADREVVAPDVPRIFGSLQLEVDAPEHERRVALANWLCNPQNPLTARVIVNRIWMHHFGEGLVDTPSDFGVMGTAPSHAGLLDWLAVELMTSGWSIKHIQRLIVRSRSWRQSSRPHAAALAKDKMSRLLWRFPPRRMAAEALRDSLLAVAGTLDTEGGGAGFSVFEPDTNYVRVYTPKTEYGPDTYRRMIYMTKVRMERDGIFGIFDTPDAGQVCPKRPRSTTALQALNLFNSPFVMQRARDLATRLERELPMEAYPGGQHRIERAFELAFGRSPDPQERAAALELVNQHGLPALCRALFNANEFAFLQ